MSVVTGLGVGEVEICGVAVVGFGVRGGGFWVRGGCRRLGEGGEVG